MRKQILRTGAALMAGMMLMACAGGGATAAKEETTAASAQAGETAQAATEDKKKIAILLNGNLGDKAFFDSAANGGKLIEEELGYEVDVVEMSYDETKWEPTLLDFSEQEDVDIIVVGTWQLPEMLHRIAPEFPDKKYIIFDSSVDYSAGDMSNVYSIEYKQNECSFLAGAVAGIKSESGIIGFVGGMEGSVINDFLLGYIQGATHVAPETKVAISYIGNYSDSAKAKELALAQINQGADIVYQVASTAGLGVIDAATEKDLWAIGVDSDQAEAFLENDKDKAEHIITSALKRIDMSILRAIKLDAEGKLPWGEREVLGIQEEAVGIARNAIYEAALTEEERAKIDELEKGILDGSITVDTAFGKSTDEIQTIRNSVKP